MTRLGDLGGIIFNRKSKNLVGGNQRITTIGDTKPVIEKTYAKPTKQGTVAVGYIEFEGERFNYREVIWTPAQEKEAMVAANVATGEWDWDALKNDDSWDLNDLADWGVPDADYYALGGGEKGHKKEKNKKPGKADDNYSTFELIMLHDNKVRLIAALNKVKKDNELAKQEDAIMYLIEQYRKNQ